MSEYQETYGDKLFSFQHADEEERLKYLAEATDPDTLRHLSSLKINDAARCLDIGPGYGSIPAWLARTPDIDTSEIVAADKDINILIKQLGELDITLKEIDVRDEGIDLGTFDLIHTRFLMALLPERIGILERLISWLRPGGYIVITDFHWNDSLLPQSEFKCVMQAMWSVLSSRIGNDYTWIVSAGERLSALGCHDVKTVESTEQTRQSLKSFVAFWVSTLTSLKQDLLEVEGVTPAIFDKALADTERCLALYGQPQIMTCSGQRKS